jgi:hypothetical protein
VIEDEEEQEVGERAGRGEKKREKDVFRQFVGGGSLGNI